MTKGKEHLRFWLSVGASVFALLVGTSLLYVGRNANSVLKNINRLPQTEQRITTCEKTDSLFKIDMDCMKHTREIDSINRANRDEKLNIKLDIVINGVNNISKKLKLDPVYVPKNSHAETGYIIYPSAKY